LFFINYLFPQIPQNSLFNDLEKQNKLIGCKSNMVKTDNFQKAEVSSCQELRVWLENNHAQKESVWLVTFKKTVPEKYISTTEVLDELLWLDRWD
jgi:hypothetical protein